MAVSGIRAQKKQAAMALVRDAGLKLAAVRPYDGITVEDIARASGVAPATIYRHFGHKSHIFAWPLQEPFPLDLVEGLLADEDLPVALFRLAAEFDGAFKDTKRKRLQHLRLVLDVPELRSQFEADLSVWAASLARLVSKTPEQPDIGARAATGAAASVLRMSLDAWAQSDGDAALLDLVDAACSGIESHFQY